MREGDPFYERSGEERITHAYAGGPVAQQGFRTRCGTTVFRSRAEVHHPLLPARVCAGCFPDRQPPQVPIEGFGGARGGAG